uniref:Uncharacterized protein n=1 Tax=Amphimedon queenslandica TaxID=400682 RepID=A0A1X7V4P6_AMPQE
MDEDLRNPFKDLQSSYKQKKAYKSIGLVILCGHSRSDDLIEDYCDGSLLKKHPLFSVCSTALQLMLYYNDLEVCNFIRSRAKKRKLGNLNPKLRSSLKIIQLVSIVRRSIIQDYGIDKDEGINMKDEGINIKIQGQQHNIRGTISLVCADNLLAGHWVDTKLLLLL